MKLLVNGGHSLSGAVKVGGSKNAALPILFSTLLVNGTTEIENLPDIGDVKVALKLLEDLGAVIFRTESSVFINTEKARYSPPDPALVSKIRASTYLIGACLSRFGVCDLLQFGGCNFSDRPIDLHLFAAETLGAKVGRGRVSAKRLCGGDIAFPKISVGATVNALIMAQAADGVTTVQGYAKEPHVLAFIDFLRSCGADIEVMGNRLVIRKSALRGGKFRIIGDMIEAGTYLSLALATGGDVRITGVDPKELTSVLNVLDGVNASFDLSCNCIRVKGRVDKPLSVRCGPFPDFPTDLQPVFAPLMASCGGKIVDTVWCERFGYLSALALFGVRSIRIKSGAIVYPSELVSARVTAPDLRGGAACLIAALSAHGESEISSANVIMRGYGELTAKLRALGADISEA